MLLSVELASYSLPQPRLWVCVLGAFVAYRLSRFAWDVLWSPLAAIPGPWTRAASRLPFATSILRGNIVRDAVALHREYGPIVRIAPNEVSFASEESYHQILSGNDQRFLKDSVWWGEQPGMPTNIVTCIDPEKHRRIRRVLAPSFAPEAVRDQEQHIQTFVNLLIRRLRGVVNEAGAATKVQVQANGAGAEQDATAIVDMVPWLNYTTFDIFGALYFGNSFECLQRSDYHPWVALLYSCIKATAFVAAARLYPVGQFLLVKCLPKSLRRVQADHYGHIVGRLDARLAVNDGKSSDLMAYILRRNLDKSIETDIWQSTMMLLTIAGSETTGTALTGIVHCVANNPDKFAALAHEVRSRFDTLDAITLDAVNKLPYLTGVIKEGLRLCPPIPFVLPRVVPKGGEVICGTWIPGGTAISIQAYVMSRDPKYFYDPEAFIPERWLSETSESSDGSSSGNTTSIHGEEQPAAQKVSSPFAMDRSSASLPFSLGPRVCPGRTLAWAEMRLIVAKLVWAFDLLPIEEGKPGVPLRWEDKPVYILVEKFPIEVRLRERQLGVEKD